MTNWTHATMDSRQAYQRAQQFYLQVENIHPFYGIEEFYAVEIAKLKKVAQLRSQIRRAEILESSPGEMENWWQELRKVMTA